MTWQTEDKRYGDGGLLSGVVLARSHASSTLYFGIVSLCTFCTLIDKAWFTYNSRRAPKRDDPDPPTALSLARDGGRNLDAYVCFLGATWRGDRGLSYDVLWAL